MTQETEALMELVARRNAVRPDGSTHGHVTLEATHETRLACIASARELRNIGHDAAAFEANGFATVELCWRGPHAKAPALKAAQNHRAAFPEMNQEI